MMLTHPFILLVLSNMLCMVSASAPKPQHFMEESNPANVIGKPVQNVVREKCVSLCRSQGSCKGITMYHPSNGDATVCYMTKKGKNGWRDDQFGRHEFTSMAMVRYWLYIMYIFGRQTLVKKWWTDYVKFGQNKFRLNLENILRYPKIKYGTKP